MVGVVLLPVCSTLHHWGDLSWQVCLDPGDYHHHHHHCYQHINSNININMISTIISIHLVPTSPEGHVQMLIIIVLKLSCQPIIHPGTITRTRRVSNCLFLDSASSLLASSSSTLLTGSTTGSIRHLCLFRKLRYQLLPSHFDCHSVFLRTSNENWCSG